MVLRSGASPPPRANTASNRRSATDVLDRNARHVKVSDATAFVQHGLSHRQPLQIEDAHGGANLCQSLDAGNAEPYVSAKRASPLSLTRESSRWWPVRLGKTGLLGVFQAQALITPSFDVNSRVHLIIHLLILLLLRRPVLCDELHIPYHIHVEDEVGNG